MLFLDTSALVKRYVEEEGAEFVLRRMDEDPDWVVSSVARTETQITLCRLGFDPERSPDLWQRLRDDWDRCHLVPVDSACLEAAVGVGCRLDVRTLDALHLAAAARMPRPLVMLTFDGRQADAARSMGIVVEGA